MKEDIRAEGTKDIKEVAINEPMDEKLYLVLIGTPGIFATIIRMVTRIEKVLIMALPPS